MPIFDNFLLVIACAGDGNCLGVLGSSMTESETPSWHHYASNELVNLDYGQPLLCRKQR